MKKTKAIAMIVVFIMLVSTILNCVAIGSVNAEETVNIKKVVTSTNGTVEYEISGLEIEEGHEYQWGIVKTKGDTINDDKWNDVLAPNFNTKTIKATVDSTKYLDILKASDDAYISVKEKGKTTNILDEAKVDLSLPLGKSYSVEKSKWYNRNVPSNPAFSIDSVYGISPSEIQYGWEEITDASIINSYIDNNHDISGLNVKGKDEIPSDTSTIWKSITTIDSFGTGGLKNSQLPADDGLYYLWLKNSSSNIKTVYGQVIVEIGEVKKVTNNTDGQNADNQNTDNQNTEGVKLDPNNLISYPMFIFGSDGTITIDNSQTGYELYYQCVEIDDATYQKITDKNTTREKAIGLIPKYNDNNWKKTTDNKFTIDTSTYTGKKAFAVWSKLKSSDGTISYDVEVYSVSGTKVESESKSHRYEIIEQEMTWEEAKAYCESKGGYLATITSAEEQKMVEKVIEEKNYGDRKIRFWIGATDKEVEGQWKWVTGEKFDYTNWGAQEPDNTPDQDYIVIHSYIDTRYGIEKYQWDDINNSQAKEVTTYFICEYGDYEKEESKVDTTTATTSIPQTGQSFAIVAIIAVILMIGLIGFKSFRKNRDIK